MDLKSFDDSLASVDHVLLAGLSRDELALAEQTVAAQLHLLIQILKQSVPVVQYVLIRQEEAVLLSNPTLDQQRE